MPKKKAAKNSGPQSLLVELLTEELPPKSLHDLSKAFSAGVEEGLRNRGLLNPDSAVTSFATPRRLAVCISSILAKGADKSVEQKLMPLSAARAADGTLSSEALQKKLAGMGRTHLAGSDSIYVKSDGKSEYVYLSALEPGWKLVDALQRTLQDAVEDLPIPKVMNYPLANRQEPERFVRPVRRLLALHGNKVLDVSILGLKATNLTRGHRFLAKSDILVRHADNYEQVLEKSGRIIASFAKRKELIRAELEKKAAGAKIVWDDALLDEVTALVEYPVVYSGSFSPEFLVLPQECLILSLQRHQRYFPITDESGRLMPRFLMVSNMRTANPANIIRGNERVLRARLADAKFFYDQDHKEFLQARVPRLAQVVYHRKLGSQLDRVIRIQELAGRIAHGVGADVELAKRAAWLSKADLLTGMVGEFPELQGVMGAYYADDDHEDSAVVRALAAQYKLRFEEDSGVTPESLVSASLYLADRIDALVGFFGIGETPTGEKDPFGLRRAALGVISAFELIGAARKIAGKEIPDVRDFLTYASSLFPTGLLTHRVVDQVHDFILERYWNNLAAVFPKDAVEAVISQKPNLAEVNARVQAVQTFRKLPEAESLASANKRIRNILKKSDAAPGRLDEALLKEPTEQALYDSVKKIEPQIESNMLRRDYTGALKILAGIRVVVDKFFDDVLVNTEDMQLRANRLALLHRLNKLMNQVADISKLAQ